MNKHQDHSEMGSEMGTHMDVQADGATPGIRMQGSDNIQSSSLLEEQSDQQEEVNNEHYAIISLIYHALQGRQTYEIYEKDARVAGKHELAQFFADVQEENLKRVMKARKFLKDWVQESDEQISLEEKKRPEIKGNDHH